MVIVTATARSCSSRRRLDEARRRPRPSEGPPKETLMKTGAEKGRSTAQDFDLRVRDRHLMSGTLDPKVVERYLAELPDLEAQAESLPIDQPALGSADGGRPGAGP